MGGSTTRKSYTKIKNFTEKDQVRIKYSHIGKDNKLMLSVYIGEDVYKELTNGYIFKRLKVEYIPNDMVIITPTNNEKEGIVHRYNGKGLFKTTCVRLSLSSYKKLKVRKKDFNNRVVDYVFASRSDGKCLNVDLIGSKKPKFVNKVDVSDVVPQSYVSNGDLKPLQISAPEEDMDDASMFVSHHFLNEVRDAIENRLLAMEERFEKRVKEQEDYFLKKFETHITGTFATRLNILEENVKFLSNTVEINVDAINTKQNDISTSLREINYYKGAGLVPPLPTSKSNSENTLDIDTLKQLFDKVTDTMNFKLSKIEKEVVELVSKSVDLNSRLNLLLQKLEDKTADPEYMSFRFMEIKDLLNQIKKSHEHKSLFERIFGKE